MEAATTKQLNLLNKLGVKYDDNISIKQASILIAKTLKQNRQNNNTNNTESQKNNTIKTSIFDKNTFNEYKQLFYSSHYSYYKESNFNKKFQYVIKIDNNFIVFDYPEIETRFCFGHGQNGISTQEEENDAYNRKHVADTNQDYFISENLKDINHEIESLNNYIVNDYCNQFIVIEKQWSSGDFNEVFYEEVLKYNERYTNSVHWIGGTDVTDRILKVLSKDEIQKIINALQEIKNDFTKRLNTYLKKYGLSKLHTWTYLVD